MNTHSSSSQQRGAQTMPTVLPAIRPYTPDFPGMARSDLRDRVVYYLLDHASDSSGPPWYTLAKTMVWGITTYYEEQTSTLTLGVYRSLIVQVVNFLWGLPDPYRADVEWDEEQCGEWADRIMNGVLQTIRPDFFATQEKEEEQRCCVCGRTAEGTEQVCDCVCPECETHTFDDIILGEHGRCWDCWKKWQLRPEQIASEAQAWMTHRCEEGEGR